MENTPNDYKGHLIKPKNVMIKNNVIHVKNSTNPEYYLPFNYYILCDKDKNSIHRLFANLDYTKDDEIINFCSNYGLLGTYEKPGFNIEKYTKEPIDYFKSQCRSYQFIISLLDAVTSNDVNQIKKVYKKYDHTPTINEDIKEMEEDIIQGASGLIIWYINERLENTVHPFIPTIKDTNYTYDTTIPKIFGWRCDCLISDLYLMMYLDYKNGFTNKPCKFCNEIYLATRSNIYYCSTTCQNADKQKRYRRKLKFEKLLNGGKSKKEIMQVITDIPEEQIDKWIDEYNEER